MQVRSKAINSNSGKEMYRKFTTYSTLLNIKGNRAVTKITIEIIMVNAIIRYLNFNENAPNAIKMAVICSIIERIYNVNDTGFII